jgi:DNA replication protein DnaC
LVVCDGISQAEGCECLAQLRLAQLERTAKIPATYRTSSLTDYPETQRALYKVFLEVQAFAREFPCGNKLGLLLLGDVGSGKTHLAVAALRSLFGRGFTGLFYDYQALVNKIRADSVGKGGVGDCAVYNEALNTEILLLDDLGACRPTEWIEDTVTSILSWRCNHRRPLIATTSLTDPDAGGLVMVRNSMGQVSYRAMLADRIGVRARSRLFEMCHIVLMPKLEDYRIKGTF